MYFWNTMAKTLPKPSLTNLKLKQIQIPVRTATEIMKMTVTAQAVAMEAVAVTAALTYGLAKMGNYHCLHGF